MKIYCVKTGQDFELDIKLTDRSYKKASRRKIAEFVLIEQLEPNETMNSKNEWSYMNLNKVHVG